MDNRIFISTLVYKNIVDKTFNGRHLIYIVLGPMLGTMENDIFINTHDRKYFSILTSGTNMNEKIRYAYCNKISLYDAKKKYKSNDLEKIIRLYKEEYINDSYYVIDKYMEDPLIIRYNEKKFKRVYENNIVRPI